MIGIHWPIGWADWLAVINVVTGFCIVAVNIILIRQRESARPLRYVGAIVGLYWGALYFFVYLVRPGYVDAVMFGQVFVRPAFTFTLALLLAFGIWRLASKDDNK